jgi:transposase, IS30 family
MKQQRRIYYTETQKALMWDRWQKGESLHSIGSDSIDLKKLI